MQKSMGRCEWGGRISGTKGGGPGGIRWGDEVQGGGAEWDGRMGCAGMQNEEISKETVGE